MEEGKVWIGKIKFYKFDKHYGFIVFDETNHDGAKEIFFHKIELLNDYIPRLEEKVQFTIGKYKGTYVATKIQKAQ